MSLGHDSLRSHALFLLRYGLPAVFFAVGWLILAFGDGPGRWEGWSMCLGAAGSLLLLNVLFRLGARGDSERHEEEAARDYYGRHGHWPDEEPPT